MRKPVICAAALAFVACAGNPEPSKTAAAPPTPSAAPTTAVPVEPPPEGSRLATDVTPTAERIELAIAPDEPRFSGKVDIAVRLDRARGAIYLHGKKLDVARATFTPKGGAPFDATWTNVDATGMASLTAPQGFPAGEGTIHLEYSGDFAQGLKGLYKTKQSGRAYAFTQFEATAAREAFPCFDEPGLKIPFDVTLVVPKDDEAIANTRDVETRDDGANKRVRFATTRPLPTYLVAFAVGPLDVVKAPDVPANMVRMAPLPLRGIAAKGRGPELAYALAHTGELVTELEKYFGVAYPYDKLDVLAVPDKTGAMENAGAITFREYLLLMDEKSAPIWQKKAFAEVMAHELAHQWTGDLVTMKWWDDTWLNEAFATWAAPKAVDAWNASYKAGLGLLEGVQGAMGTDALVSARAIRQPIASAHDIENAFDGITYQKGAGVIRMFEQWMGEPVFQKGVHTYLQEHAFGNASADDLLDTLAKTAGKDVKTPFHTFLDQPGVPFVEAEVKCDGKTQSKLHLKQSRFLPLGSTGDASKTWQIPICAKVGRGSDVSTACTLLSSAEGDLDLGGACPSWVLPNAEAAGYFRFALAPKDLDALRKAGLAKLTVREKTAFANSVRAGYSRGATPMKDAIAALAGLANEEEPSLANEAMGMVSQARDWLFSDASRPHVEAYAKSLYAGAWSKLGWQAAKGEDTTRGELRADVLHFLLTTARDPALRAEAKKRARAFLGLGGDGAIHKDAIDANLVSLCLMTLGEDADAATFDGLVAQLGKTEDDVLRSRILGALASAKDPPLAEKARALALDPRLRVTEVFSPLAPQLNRPETRDAAWTWVKSNFDALLARVPAHHGGPRLLGLAGGFCDDAHAQDAEAFLAGRAASIEGGPRVLASTLESVRLCAARRKAQEPSARQMFAK